MSKDSTKHRDLSAILLLPVIQPGFTRTFHIGWPTDNVAYFLAAFSEVGTAHLRQNLLSKIFELILALPVQGVATGASPNAMPFCRGITFDLCCSLVLSSAMECASYIAALLH